MLDKTLFVRLLTAATIGFASFFCAASVQAGACPPCNSAADCGGDGHFCVRWNASPGCGTETQICCPGQGCNTFSGRPSCEGTGACVVVGDAPPDAGSLPRTDAGPSVRADAGSSAMSDGGGGGGGGGGRSDGCGCRVARPAVGDVGGGLAAALVVVGLTMRLRRRRAPARPR